MSLNAFQCATLHEGCASVCVCVCVCVCVPVNTLACFYKFIHVILVRVCMCVYVCVWQVNDRCDLVKLRH